MPAWCDPETVIVRTWCVYAPRTGSTPSLGDPPCVLVMRATEKEVVELLGERRAYSWEWERDPKSPWGLRL